MSPTPRRRRGDPTLDDALATAGTTVGEDAVDDRPGPARAAGRGVAVGRGRTHAIRLAEPLGHVWRGAPLIKDYHSNEPRLPGYNLCYD